MKFKLKIPKEKKVLNTMAIAESFLILLVCVIKFTAKTDKNPDIDPPTIKYMGFLVPDKTNPIQTPGQILCDIASTINARWLKTVKTPTKPAAIPKNKVPKITIFNEVSRNEKKYKISCICSIFIYIALNFVLRQPID